jgi:hypothetical protein
MVHSCMNHDGTSMQAVTKLVGHQSTNDGPQLPSAATHDRTNEDVIIGGSRCFLGHPRPTKGSLIGTSVNQGTEL